MLIESVSFERTGERAKPMIEKRREVERPLSRLEPKVIRRWRPSTRRARAMAASRDEGERSFLKSSWWTLQNTSTQQTCQVSKSTLAKQINTALKCSSAISHT